MSQRSKKVDARVYLERETLHDKSRPLFRPKYPPVYKIMIVVETGKRRIILREESYGSKQLQTSRYNELRRMFNMEAK